MTKISSLFYNSDSGIINTLHKNITPDEDQMKEQQNRWQDLGEYLKETLNEETGIIISTWLQGSYKFRTQLRPIKGEEFDIDLGIYFEVSQKPNEDQYNPKNLKHLVQKHLTEYSSLSTNNSVKVLDPPKERCNRISFEGEFHIDTPCYYKIKDTNFTELATESSGWENSDPKGLFDWFQNCFDESGRALARRLIQYIKCWSNITFVNDKKDGSPSSILITVLVAESLMEMPSSILDLYDDEALTKVVNHILKKLISSNKVYNPVDNRECISNRIEDFDILLSELEKFSSVANEAVDIDSTIIAALKWQESFQHLFPIPTEEESIKSVNNSLTAYKFDPIINVVARSKTNEFYSRSDVNKIGPIAKNCSIEFQISNADQIPLGSKIQWMVRNHGNDSKYVNDFGHNAGNKITATESSAYRGVHYMDCLITRDKQIIAFKRVPVEIEGLPIPKRNPPRPKWVNLRKKRG